MAMASFFSRLLLNTFTYQFTRWKLVEKTQLFQTTWASMLSPM